MHFVWVCCVGGFVFWWWFWWWCGGVGVGVLLGGVCVWVFGLGCWFVCGGVFGAGWVCVVWFELRPLKLLKSDVCYSRYP